MMTAWLLTLALLHGADAATTYPALAHGAIERNPFLPDNPTANLVAHAGIASGYIYGLHKLSQSHPTEAKIITWMAIGLESYAVINNARLLHQQSVGITVTIPMR